MNEKKSILIIDDDDDIRRSLTLIFGKKGYETETVGTGRRAIEKVQAKSFSMALVDLKLPDIEGLDLIVPLKKIRPDMVIILFTAYASLETAIRALDEGVSAYITKPLNMDEVLVIVRQALEKQHLVFEKRQMEKVLRESEEKYRTILESIEDGYYEVDLSGNFTFFNDSMCKISGYSRNELMGMNNRQYMDPETAKRVNKIFREVHKTGKVVKGVEWESITKDGAKRPIESSVTLMKDLKGQTLGFRGIVRDMTEHKKLEEQLRQSQKMEAISSLAGGIAHEFNNILTTIIGNTELAIGDIPERNPARECLEEISTASLRAKDVVRQILGFARKSVFQLMPVQISPIIRDALILIRASIPATIEIRQNLSCESDTVMADSSQINLVFLNLCANAKNAMQEEGGVLEAKLENTTLDEKSASRYKDLGPGNYVRMTVRDTGHGIDPKIINRIFEPYFTTSILAEATGMGLAVVHGIVKRHNGAITAASEPGKGTVFEVLFPVLEGEMEPEAEGPGALPTGNEKILFIDDEESILKLAKKRLEMQGYQVEAKNNPVDALELIRSKPNLFDLIITDMTMPKITGDKLAKEILSIRPDMPIILCSGYSDRIDDEKAAALGICKYIEKPLNMQDFLVAVRKVLDEAKSSTQV